MTRTWIAVAAGVATLALPAAARADTYCVSNPSSCSGTPEASLGQALTAAQTHAGRDRIEIGPGTFDGPFLTNDTGGVDIVGSGSGAGGTLLTDSTAPGGFNPATTLTVTGNSSSTLSNLAAAMPNGLLVGAIVTDAAVRQVAVADSSLGTAITLEQGASLSHADVRLDNGAGVDLANGTSVTDSSIQAATGVQIDGSGAAATIQRDTIDAFVGISYQDARATVLDSLIRVEPGGSAGTRGIFADAQGSDPPPFLHADGLTIVGPGTSGSQGIVVHGQNATVSDSIVTGFEHSLEVDSLGANVSLTLDHSNYDTEPVDIQTTPPRYTITETNRIVGDPGFANPAAGDYSLRADSILVDAGNPAGLASGEDPLDLAGNPRIAGARRDVGAYEFQPPPAPPPPAPQPPGPPPTSADVTPPTISGAHATHTVFAVARAVTPVSARRRTPKGTTFRYGLSEAAKVKLVIQQELPGRRVGKRCRKPRRHSHGRRCKRFVEKGTLRRAGTHGVNSVRFSGRIGHHALKPGRYRLTITATDLAGNVTRKPARLSFRIVRAAKHRHR